MRLPQKGAIVTGGTRGIGLAIAHRFAAEGARVVLCGRDEATAQEVAASLPPVEHGPHVGIGVDLASSEQTEEFVVRSVEALGRIDILVNNAGITRDNLLIRMKQEDWDDVLETNLTAVYRLTRAVARHMLRQRAGRIVNVTSVSGMIGNAGQVNYAAAKAGVVGLTKSLARELASRNITVNAVAPGYIETDMTAALPEAVREQTLSQIPLGRYGRPEEIAAAVLFLCEDENAYITGHTLVCDGGIVMH